jgi:molecular chaperone DnaJ
MNTAEALAELGLNTRATADMIKRAYRILARKWHPDVNRSPFADQKMKALNVAYAALDGYDASAAVNGFDPEYFGPGGGTSGFDGFESMYPKRGRNISRKVKLTLFEAAFGCRKIIEGKVTDNCLACSGSGVSGETRTCPGCGGHGYIYRGRFGMGDNCPTCGGNGRLHKRCNTCGGTGRGGQRSWSVEVKFPSGVVEGNEVIARGMGGRSRTSGTNGDLCIKVELVDHPLFLLADRSLHVSMPISVWTWFKGGDIVVPTLDGSVVFRVAPAQPFTFEIKQQGWPAARGSVERGPLVVHLELVLEDNPTAEQVALLAAVAAAKPLKRVTDWENNVRRWCFATAAERFPGDKKKQWPKA